jgi:hypothetical protein
MYVYTSFLPSGTLTIANRLRRPSAFRQSRAFRPDGRNRLLACREADVEPAFKEYTGDTPVSWVLSQNVKRRDLTATQRATIGFESLPLRENEAKARQHAAGARGSEAGRGNKKTLQEKVPAGNSGQARTHAAKAVGVNDRYISDVKKIVSKAPELLEKMKSGEVTISEAQQQLGFKQTVAAPTFSESERLSTKVLRQCSI